MFVGVDGWSKGWIAVVLDRRAFVEALSFDNFGLLVAHFEDAKAIGVDMPLGLVDAGDRAADSSARAFLTGQASSVFNAPARGVLAATSYEDAAAKSKALSGKGLSKQSFNLMPKIIEVDAFASDARVHEVHPEIGFRLMNGGKALAHSKKRYGGMRQRLELLRESGIDLPADIGEAGRVPIDDVIDAAAAAWSARRIARGQARSFPEEPIQRDASGRQIVIRA